jgi:hypothetical protein
VSGVAPVRYVREIGGVCVWGGLRVGLRERGDGVGKSEGMVCV